LSGKKAQGGTALRKMDQETEGKTELSGLEVWNQVDMKFRRLRICDQSRWYIEVLKQKMVPLDREANPLPYHQGWT
jgi:hypothetical protein